MRVGRFERSQVFFLTNTNTNLFVFVFVFFLSHCVDDRFSFRQDCRMSNIKVFNNSMTMEKFCQIPIQSLYCSFIFKCEIKKH